MVYILFFDNVYNKDFYTIFLFSVEINERNKKKYYNVT